MIVKPETKEIIRLILGVGASKIAIDWLSMCQSASAGQRHSIADGGNARFDGVTEYKPGMSTDDIDWFASALLGGQKILADVRKQKQSVTGFVLADVSPAMDFGVARSKRELAAEMSALAIGSASLTRDQMALATFSRGRREAYLPPSYPGELLLPALAHILEGKETSPHPGSGLSEAIGVLPADRSLVFVVSDFAGKTDSDWQAMRHLGRSHDVIAIFVQDLRERELPVSRFGGLLRLRDGDGKTKVIWNNASTRRRYSENFRRHEASVLAKLNEAHARPVVVSTRGGEENLRQILRVLERAQWS